MNRMLTLFAMTLLFNLNAMALNLRETINFNREWKFLLGDHAGAEAVSYDDAQWNAIGLPHSFSIPYFAGNDKFYVGYDPQSDIAIRDGQAAIEFRSHYAGETVIRATSPGLKDATLKIVSEGGPAFVAGKTVPVKPRPYVRFEGQPGSPGSEGATNFGRENPTRASSEAPGHSARFANDGDPASFWQSADARPNAWWQVDLERVVAVKRTRLIFPEEGDYRYKIEVSEDGNRWKLAVDRTHTAATRKERTDSTAPGATCRFVRITFTGVPTGKSAALSEVGVSGNLTSK